ncbi:hypothetical protein RE6C_03539 [Rhodopirellula europaea 6C]|uniref:Uncharacterized protein n=1 Tax=Rhodopirellula europaea 6C TaxID=1263867 RepID=M2AF21_9BACT|nr:hypothetical protein RE6C_03539 [Rhodopirellula europaea 6C]
MEASNQGGDCWGEVRRGRICVQAVEPACSPVSIISPHRPFYRVGVRIKKHRPGKQIDARFSGSERSYRSGLAPTISG